MREIKGKGSMPAAAAVADARAEDEPRTTGGERVREEVEEVVAAAAEVIECFDWMGKVIERSSERISGGVGRVARASIQSWARCECKGGGGQELWSCKRNSVMKMVWERFWCCGALALGPASATSKSGAAIVHG
jgi:hypothetical protein